MANNQAGPPKFDYAEHEARAKEELATIRAEKREKIPVVYVTHTDGRGATVNADPTDEGFKAFMCAGFTVKDEDKHLVVAPRTEAQEKQELMDRLAVLESRLAAMPAEKGKGK